MNVRHLVLVGGLLALSSLPFPEGAAASCAAPYLQGGDAPVLTRGSTGVVEGRAFVEGCQDTGSCTEQLGCSHCDPGEEERPLTDVPLTLVQDGRRWPLGAADAGGARRDELGWITWTFEVPDGVRPGPARLVAPPARPLRVRLG